MAIFRTGTTRGRFSKGMLVSTAALSACAATWFVVLRNFGTDIVSAGIGACETDACAILSTVTALGAVQYLPTAIFGAFAASVCILAVRRLRDWDAPAWPILLILLLLVENRSDILALAARPHRMVDGYGGWHLVALVSMLAALAIAPTDAFRRLRGAFRNAAAIPTAAAVALGLACLLPSLPVAVAAAGWLGADPVQLATAGLYRVPQPAEIAYGISLASAATAWVALALASRSDWLAPPPGSDAPAAARSARVPSTSLRPKFPTP